MALWTPAKLGANLLSWLDASDAATIIIDNGHVAQWTDKSGYGRHATQGFDPWRPSQVGNSVRFTGPACLGFSGPSGAYDFIFVARLNSINFWRTPFFATTSYLPLIMDSSNPANIGYYDPIPTYHHTCGLTWANNTDGIIYGSISSTNVSYAKDGSGLASAGPGFPTTNITQLCRTDDPQPIGDIYELIIAPNNSLDKQRLEGYCAWKWGLQGSLPTDHPYKSATPVVDESWDNATGSWDTGGTEAWNTAFGLDETLYPSAAASVEPSDPGAYTFGARITCLADGQITAIRWWHSSGSTTSRFIGLWTDAGVLLASGTSSGEVSGWNVFSIGPIAVTAGQVVRVGYGYKGSAIDGSFAYSGSTGSMLPGPHLQWESGVYSTADATFPSITISPNNYYADIVYQQQIPQPSPPFRSETHTGYGGGQSQSTVNCPANVQPGDILFCVGGVYNPAGDYPVQVFPPDPGWIEIDSNQFVAQGWTVRLYMWWKRVTATPEPSSYTFTHAFHGGINTYSRDFGIVAYSGCVISGSPIDSYTQACGGQHPGVPPDNTNLITIPGITPTQDNTKIVFCQQNWGATGSLTPPTGFTERWDTITYEADQDWARAYNPTGPVTQDFYYNSGGWSMNLVVLKPLPFGAVGVFVTGPAALTTSVGTVAVTNPVSVSTTVSMTGMTASVGTVTASAAAKATVTMTGMTASIGNVTIIGKASAVITITAMTAAVGNVTASVGIPAIINVSLKASWTPNLLPILSSWLDAAQAPFTDGQAITSYTEHSNNARVFTSTPGYEPIFRTGGGRKRLEFTTARPTWFGISSYQAPTTGLTYALIGRDTGPSSYGMWVTYSGTSGTLELRHSGASYTVQVVGNNAGTVYSSSVDVVLDVDGILYLENNPGANITLWMDGTNRGSGPAPAVMQRPVSNLNIGSRVSDGYYLNSDINEILILDGVAVQADREKIEGYFAWKWGTVAALPAGHPYKSAAPVGSDIVLTVSVGSVSVTAQSKTTVTNAQLTASVGTVSVVGKAVVNATSPVNTAFVGTVITGGSVIANVTGFGLAASIGNVTVVGKVNFTLTSPQSAVFVGTASVVGKAIVTITSPQVTAFAGLADISASGNIGVTVSGFAITASVGNVTLAGLDARVPVGGGTQWTPSLISNLNVWLDASALGLSDGGNVMIWPNAGASSNPTIEANVQPITFKANALNGKGVLRFSGGNGSHMHGVTNATTSYTMVYITRRWGPIVGRAFSTKYPPTNVLAGFHASMQDIAYDGGWLNAGTAWGDTGSLPGAWKIYAMECMSSPATSMFTVNGVFAGLSTSGISQGMGGGYVLSGYRGDNQIDEIMDCDIAEVVLYDKLLTQDERKQVEGYLAWKWALTGNLAVDHPYKNTSPSTITGNDTAVVASIGSVTISFVLSVPVTAAALPVSVGMVSVVGKSNAAITSPQMAASVGTVSVTTQQKVGVTSVPSTASVGNVTVVGKANVTLTGQVATVSAGTALASAKATVTVSTTPQLVASVGTTTVTFGQTIFAVGIPALATAVGNVIYKAPISLPVTGLEMSVSTQIVTQANTSSLISLTAMDTMTVLVSDVGFSITVAADSPAMTAFVGDVVTKYSYKVQIASNGMVISLGHANCPNWGTGGDELKEVWTEEESAPEGWAPVPKREPYETWTPVPSVPGENWNSETHQQNEWTNA